MNCWSYIQAYPGIAVLQGIAWLLANASVKSVGKYKSSVTCLFDKFDFHLWEISQA